MPTNFIYGYVGKWLGNNLDKADFNFSIRLDKGTEKDWLSENWPPMKVKIEVVDGK